MVNYVRDTKDLLDTAKEVSEWFKGDKHESLHVDCKRNIGTHTINIEVEHHFVDWVLKLIKHEKRFDLNDVYNVKVYSLKPRFEIVDDAVYNEGDCIVLDFNKVINLDLVKIDIEYRMDNDFLKSLVRSRSTPEPLDDAQKFHLSAQLRDPDLLVKNFKSVDLDEYPVTAGVQLQNKIDSEIAPYLSKLSQIEQELITCPNPRDTKKLANLKQEQTRLQRKIKDKKLQDRLEVIAKFLDPSQFLRYVRMEDSNDFRLHKCEWNELFQALDLTPLPQKMNVISRTDLSIKKPAKSGSLLYEESKFSTDIRGIFN